MAKISNIDLAYDYLSKLKDSDTFENIWNSISQNIEGDNDRKNEIIANLYSDLVLDNRFALTAEGKWGLRDYLKFEDVKKQYNYVDKFETADDFEDIDTYSDLDFKTIDISSKKFKDDLETYDEDDTDDDDDDDDSDEEISVEDTFDDSDD